MSMAESLVPAFCFMENEIWLPIPGFKGKYEASSLGRILSVFSETKLGKKRLTGTILKPSINQRGYYVLKLSGKTRKVHRLIALTFHPNPKNKPQVNHKDLNQLNNHKDNVEWATAKENTNHAQVNGRMPLGKKVYMKKGRPVGLRVILDINALVFYESPQELSDLIGVKRKYIHR